MAKPFCGQCGPDHCLHLVGGISYFKDKYPTVYDDNINKFTFDNFDKFHREQEQMAKTIKATSKKTSAKKTISSKEEEFLTPEQSIEKLTKGCEGCTNDEACCAIIGLKKAGWEIEKSPAVAHDGRKGFVISFKEPLKNTNE